MKEKVMSCIAVMVITAAGVQAQEIMVSWSSNGVLQASGMEPGSTGVVEAVSALGEIFTNAASFSSDSNGVMSITVPMTAASMFYRLNVTPPEEDPDPPDPEDPPDPPKPSVPEGMVLIPAGINTGTDPDFDEYSLTNETAFYMDETEVTNDEFVEVMQWALDNGKVTASYSTVQNAMGSAQELLDLDGSGCRITCWDGLIFKTKAIRGSGYPCVEVTWYGAAAYCNYRSEMEGKTPCYDLSDWSCDFNANGYRLPTSDEWEYAARGGLSNKRFPWGDTITHNQANYESDSGYSYDISSTRGYHPDYYYGDPPYINPVRDFAANDYGLYGMAGNVWEWCNDWHPGNEGEKRVVRGTGFRNTAWAARCGSMIGYQPDGDSNDFGFRCLLPSE